jgi:PAS domain S-box-containing protein
MIHVSQKVLCVDDQIEILDLLRTQLDTDFDCEFATSGEEGLAMLQVDGPFAVVVSDYNMPQMNGTDFLREVHTRSPDTVAMMLTAHAELDIAVGALHEGRIFRFLQKPWRKETIRRAIDDAVEQYRIVVTERMLTGALADANRNLKKKLDQLEELNQLLEYWVEFSPAVIYCQVLAPDGGKPSYVSKNFPRLTGYERTELIVNPGFWAEHQHPDDRLRVRGEIERALEDGRASHSLEYRIRHRDGHWRPIYDSFRIIRNGAGDPIELVGAWMDVSARGASI